MRCVLHIDVKHSDVLGIFSAMCEMLVVVAAMNHGS